GPRLADRIATGKAVDRHRHQCTPREKAAEAIGASAAGSCVIPQGTALFLGLGGLLLRRGRLLLRRGLLRLCVLGIVGQQYLAAHLLVGDADLPEQMVYHLLLEDGRPDAGKRRRVVAVELEGLLLLARREAADLLVQRTLQFVVGDGNAGLLANLCKHQPEP